MMFYCKHNPRCGVATRSLGVISVTVQLDTNALFYYPIEENLERMVTVYVTE